MSYISILLPAFFCHDTELEKIKEFSEKQFMRDIDEMEIIKVNQEPLEYAIKFQNSDLSLDKIEDLINQRNNMKIILEKTYESMNILMKKFIENENNINSISKTPKNNLGLEIQSIKSHNKILEDNIKLKEILKKQLDHSENFRINTEQILNSLREEFNFLVLEIENMKKTNKNKIAVEYQQVVNNENKRPGTTNIYEIEMDESEFNNLNMISNNTQTTLANTFNKKLSININNYNNNLNNQK